MSDQTPLRNAYYIAHMSTHVFPLCRTFLLVDHLLNIITCSNFDLKYAPRIVDAWRSYWSNYSASTFVADAWEWTTKAVISTIEYWTCLICWTPTYNFYLQT